MKQSTEVAMNGCGVHVNAWWVVTKRDIAEVDALDACAHFSGNDMHGVCGEGGLVISGEKGFIFPLSLVFREAAVDWRNKELGEETPRSALDRERVEFNSTCAFGLWEVG